MKAMSGPNTGTNPIGPSPGVTTTTDDAFGLDLTDQRNRAVVAKINRMVKYRIIRERGLWRLLFASVGGCFSS